jgi:hypothetical protein
MTQSMHARMGWLAIPVALVLGAAAPAALAASGSVRLNVSVTVLPSKRQRTLDSAIQVRAPDGTAVTLDRQQKLLYLQNPQALVQALVPNATGPVVVTMEM